MAATVICELHFGATNAQRGFEVVQKIWSDMKQLPGCLDSEIMHDSRVPGHILVVSHWTSAEAAEIAKKRYLGHPNAFIANELASEPPRWIVAVPFEGTSETEKAA